MRTIRQRLGGEDGSAMLISLMMIFIMTILGLALFDLGVIENRLTAANEADARALEIANAGLERAYRIQLANMTASNSLANLGFSDTVYFPSTVTNRPFLGEPGRPGGTYSLEFMNVKVTQGTTPPPSGANDAPFGQPCIRDPSPLFLTPVCADLLFVRSRGFLLATGGSPSATYGRVRAVQILLRAESLSPFRYAVTAETQGPNQISGLIAGSVNFLRCPSSDGFITTCNPFGFASAATGMRNHYADLTDADSRARITRLSDVCPVGSGCGTRVFSLGATLNIAAPTASGGSPTAAVRTDANLGESANTASTYSHDGDTDRRGKGRLDNVFVGDGCSAADCSDSFALAGGGSAEGMVFVSDDNIKKPYPRRPPGSFPLLADAAQVGSTQYQHYACLAGCPGETHFFTTHGGGHGMADPPTAISTATTLTGPCDTTGTGTCPPNLGTLFSTGDFENASAFVHDFVFSNNSVDTSGTPSNRVGRLCWTGPTTGAGADGKVLLFASTATGGMPAIDATTSALRTGANCSGHLSTAAAPVLILVNGNFRLGSTIAATRRCPGTGSAGPPDNHCIQYRGAAIFLVHGTVGIDAWVQTRCVGGTGSPTFCSGEKFPDSHMIAILSSGDMSVGVSQNGLQRMMALLYTQGSFRSAGSGTGSNRVDIIGTVAARTFCFANGCGGGGNETRLFQAGLRVFPDELLPGRNRWAITPLQKFWRECVPLTVTPNYTFSPGRCPY